MLNLLDRRGFVTHDILRKLMERFGESDLLERLNREDEFIRKASGRTYFDFVRGLSSRKLIENQLRLTGLYSRAVENARDVRITNNTVPLRNLPRPFENFKILQISDLHVELSYPACDRLVEILGEVDCDICVLTGDYGVEINMALDETLRVLSIVLDHIKGPVVGVLGNHDTVALVPGIESLGVRMLVNEGIIVNRDRESLFIAGVDDARYFRLHDVDKAARVSNSAGVRLLLSHCPDIYKEAEHNGFDVMLCGHTHGGQICLPGQIPIVLDSRVPRRMGSGSWRYGRLIGYTTTGVGTSITPARLNCPPEIAVHHLQSAGVRD